MTTATEMMTNCWVCGREIALPEDLQQIPDWIRQARPKRFACASCVEADDRRQAAKAKKLPDWTADDVGNAPQDAMGLIGVPQRWRDASFTGCTDIAADDVAVVQRWATGPRGALYLSGPAGVGKTFLAVSALRYIAENGVLPLCQIKYVSETGYQDMLKASFGRGDVSPRLLPPWHPRHVPVLVFDDLGSSRLTDWMLSEVTALIEGRHGDQLATIITSNQSLNMVARTIDGRLASRIAEDGTVLEVQGRDLRLARRTVPA